LYARLLSKVVNVKPAHVLGVPAGWQRGAYSSGVITDSCGRIVPHADGSGIADLFQHSNRIAHHEFEVLGSEVVDERNARVHAVAHKNGSVAQIDEILPRGCFALRNELLFDLACEFRRRGQQET